MYKNLHFVMLYDHCVISVEKSRFFSLHCLKTPLSLTKKDQFHEREKNLQIIPKLKAN